MDDDEKEAYRQRYDEAMNRLQDDLLRAAEYIGPGTLFMLNMVVNHTNIAGHLTNVPPHNQVEFMSLCLSKTKYALGRDN